MNEQVFQLTALQLAVLVFAAIALFAPLFMVLLAIIVLGIMFAWSFASSLNLAKKLQQADADEMQTEYDGILGTHIGGVICYSVMLNLLIKTLLLTG